MKTFGKEVLDLIVNTTNVADSIDRAGELEVTIWTVLCSPVPSHQSQEIFFEVSVAVVAVESKFSIGLLVATFNLAAQ